MRSSAVAHPGPVTSWFLYWVGRAWMAVTGWDVEGEPPQFDKAVLIAAPHTTNWDLPHMLAAAWVFRLRISWLGKDSLFKNPFGWFLRLMGGVPVDRSGPHGFVQQAAKVFERTDKLILAVPPSGTRSKGPRWKSGFYWIAHTAGLPVVCGYLDYSRKVAGLDASFIPTGDVSADMDQVREIYANLQGKYPELENPIRLKEEEEAQVDEAPVAAAPPAEQTRQE